MSENLSELSIQYVKGVGPAKKKLFDNLGIQTVEDLLYFFPRRYEDRRNMSKIAQLQIGEWQSICAKVLSCKARKSWHTKKHVTEVVLDDGTGRIACTWFNQPYLSSYFKEGCRVICYGKVDLYKNRMQMIAPEYEVVDENEEDDSQLKRIVPVYSLTRGMTQRYIRKIAAASIEKYLDQLKDEIPVYLRNKHRLANIKRSIKAIHFPDDFKSQQEAIRRVSFEEFFFFQISVILRRLSIVQRKGIKHKISDSFTLAYVNSYEFELTNAQKKVIREIKADMQNNHPMLRLLQGDVGCGKTVVAFFGCMAAIENGHQAALMAPTEILARQHYENIIKGTVPKKGQPARIALLTSSLPKKERDKMIDDIKEGQIDLVIGTHALISEEVDFKDLSFVVIDEQHKFGVRQRSLLSEKGQNPDVLIMTATPIPRTLCITLYGDLDLSVIDELPKGRGQIETIHLKNENVREAYLKVHAQIKQGRQAYIIYPLVEESENLNLKAAQEMFKRFKTQEFKNLKLGLVHGQMKQADAEKVMMKFKSGEIDVLVATTILEVGVDVPNASVMLIEHAERFGLAQLHQLRGRIGRGQYDSYCLLISDPTTQEGIARLDAITKTIDGFKIAQADLEIRGPGHFFGRHQHGLNELKIANPMSQLDVLELARKDALALTKEDPQLLDKKNDNIKQVITRRYPSYLANVLAG